MTNSACNYAAICQLLEDVLENYRTESTILIRRCLDTRSRRSRRRLLAFARNYSLLNRAPSQQRHLDRLLHFTDAYCIATMRMDRNTFGRLCHLLKERGGLRVGQFVGVEEQVAIFVGVLAHHKKNRCVGQQFWRSGATISLYMHKVLGAILKLHDVLLVKPTPVTDDCNDNRWKWFKVIFRTTK